MPTKKDQITESQKYYAESFGIKPEEVVWGNAGICYGTIVVTNKDAAEKVSKKVKESGATANGGFLHGMRLGGIEENGDGNFRITH